MSRQTSANRTRFFLLSAGALCYLAIGMITRFRSQPINVCVMTWSPLAPPENWMTLRDTWWRWHQFRTVIGIAGLGALAAAALVH